MKSGAVAHTCDLVAVVPPGHHPGVLGGVVAQPPVALAVVVDDDDLAVPARVLSLLFITLFNLLSTS